MGTDFHLGAEWLGKGCQIVKHCIVIRNVGDAFFASGGIQAHVDGVELDLRDFAVFCGETGHDGTPDVLHNAVAPGAVLTSLIHIFADHGVVGHALVLVGIRRLKADGFRLENEVA